jgi:iron(III) transport system substrate-binding protein
MGSWVETDDCRRTVKGEKMKKIWATFWVSALLALLPWSWVTAQSTMELAKKEGKVVWYSSASLPLSQKICGLFNSKGLGIECVLHRDGSGVLYNRYVQEAKAGIYTADVIHTSNIGHFVTLAGKGELVKYRPQGTERFDKNFLDKDGLWSVARASVYIPIYNTTKVKESEVPKSWLDFTDPKWSGKLVHAHPNYSGFVSVGMSALVQKFGWEIFDKLAGTKPRIVQSAIDTTTFVVRGEAYMSLGGTGYEPFVQMQKGEPIKYVYPKEGVPFIISPAAILAKAPHSNAAKVFSDFLYSKDAQQLMANTGVYVANPNIEYPKEMVPLKDVNLMIISPEDAVKMRKAISDNFRQKFGV